MSSAPELKSIIIAGSTGAIGREVVVHALNMVQSPSSVTGTAVSPPFVFDRVVALSRRAIPQDEWPTVFPGINMTRATEQIPATSLGQSGLTSRLVVQQVQWEELTRAREERQGRQQSTADSSNSNRGSSSAPVVPTSPFSIDSNAIYPAFFGGHQIAVMAMGTTKKDAGSAAAFRRVDLDHVRTFAEAVYHYSYLPQATSSSVPFLKHYAQVSSQGADRNSYFLYLKTKGEADFAATTLFATCPSPPSTPSQSSPVTSVSIYQPGLLARGAEKQKARLGERIATFFMSGMPVATVGKAILVHSFQQVAASVSLLSSEAERVTHFQNKDIKQLASKF